MKSHSHKQKEMIHVAKPGAKLYFCDDTDTIRDKPGLVARITDRFMPSGECIEKVSSDSD